MGYKRIPTQLILAAFKDEKAAEAALKKMAEDMKEEKSFPVATNAAIAVKNQEGKVHVKELGKPGPLSGMLAGTAVGGTIGAVVGGASLCLLGPIGVATGGLAGGLVGGALGSVNGAAIGSYGAMTVEGMDKERLKGLGDCLEPGSSAVVLVFSEVIVSKADYKEELEEVKETHDELAKRMQASISENLKNGNNVAFYYAVDEDGVTLSKVVVGEEAAHFIMMVITQDEVAVAEAAENKDVAAAYVAVANEDGVVADGVIVEKSAIEYDVEEPKE